MRLLRSLPLQVIWLSPEHLVATAKHVLDGHALVGIPVVDSQKKIVGWAPSRVINRANDSDTLARVMIAGVPCLDGDLNVREAADEMVRKQFDIIAVTLDDKFLGVLTARDLLADLRESYDPMTNLPWGDALRSWGIGKLQTGVEIAVIFIDLDNFKQFNSEYDHVVGDQVLQLVSEHLLSIIDPETDLLVRYGGDEFAIGTTCDRAEADLLVERLRGDGRGLQLEGIPTPIRYTVGIYGGRRTRERHNVHLAANLDNLISFASRDCLNRKTTLTPTLIKSPATIFAPEIVPNTAAISAHDLAVSAFSKSDQLVSDRSVANPTKETLVPVGQSSVVGKIPAVEAIQTDDGPNGMTYVVLRSASGLDVGISLRMGLSAAESIASATAKALEKGNPGSRVKIVSVDILKAGATELVTLEVTVIHDEAEREITAKAEANGDLNETIAATVISAFFAH